MALEQYGHLHSPRALLSIHEYKYMPFYAFISCSALSSTIAHYTVPPLLPPVNVRPIVLQSQLIQHKIVDRDVAKPEGLLVSRLYPPCYLAFTHCVHNKSPCSLRRLDNNSHRIVAAALLVQANAHLQLLYLSCRALLRSVLRYF